MSKNMFITVEVWRADGEIEWLKYDDEIYRFDLSKDATAGMVDMMIAALASYNDIGGKHKEFVLNTLIKKMKNREKQIKVLYCVGVLFILAIITSFLWLGFIVILLVCKLTILHP